MASFSRALVPVTPSFLLALQASGCNNAPCCWSLGASPLLKFPFSPTHTHASLTLLNVPSVSCQDYDNSSDTFQEEEAEFMVLHEAKCFFQGLAMSVGRTARTGLILEHALMSNSMNCSSGSRSALLLDKQYTL